MSQKATRDLFRFDQLSLRTRSVKVNTPTSDHLRGEWDFALRGTTGSVVLYDTPDLSTYFVRVAGVPIAQIAEFLADSFNWEVFPENKPHRLVIESEPGGNAFFDKLVLGSSTDAHLMRLQGAREGGTGIYSWSWQRSAKETL